MGNCSYRVIWIFSKVDIKRPLDPIQTYYESDNPLLQEEDGIYLIQNRFETQNFEIQGKDDSDSRSLTLEKWSKRFVHPLVDVQYSLDLVVSLNLENQELIPVSFLSLPKVIWGPWIDKYIHHNRRVYFCFHN